MATGLGLKIYTYFSTPVKSAHSYLLYHDDNNIIHQLSCTGALKMYTYSSTPMQPSCSISAQ